MSSISLDSVVIRLRSSRLSISICFSPMPFTCPPPDWRSRWDHIRVRRGSSYWALASSTCSLPSLVAARWLNTSRMSAVRSPTRTPLPSAFSRLRCCRGVSSSSHSTEAAPVLLTRSLSSMIFPLPRYAREWASGSICTRLPTTCSPAASARRSSSCKLSSGVNSNVPRRFEGGALRPTATSTTLSTKPSGSNSSSVSSDASTEERPSEARSKEPEAA
mmetsp:Transcript_14288/g.36643  ORF Transcript_14288/g.36643 Transcript_14288/m.36643 type:complete len:218 (-) Transcript_14288:450-1103(-)